MAAVAEVSEFMVELSPSDKEMAVDDAVGQHHHLVDNGALQVLAVLCYDSKPP